MRVSVLRPMFFIAVALMVATVAGINTQTAHDGPAQLAQPEFAAPGQGVRVGRVLEGRDGAPVFMVRSPLGLAGDVMVSGTLAQVAPFRLQARPLSGRQVLSAEQTSRGPPKA